MSGYYKGLVRQKTWWSVIPTSCIDRAARITQRLFIQSRKIFWQFYEPRLIIKKIPTLCLAERLPFLRLVRTFTPRDSYLVVVPRQVILAVSWQFYNVRLGMMCYLQYTVIVTRTSAVRESWMHRHVFCLIRPYDCTKIICNIYQFSSNRP